MAKVFFNSDGSVAQLSTDSDVANLNINLADYTEKTISDADFNLVKQNLKLISLEGDTVSLQDPDPDLFTWDSFEALSQYISAVVLPKVNAFIDNNKNNSMWSGINDYKIVLDETVAGRQNTDITYPLNSWEKYCADNSIAYYHPLQIP